MSLGLPVVATLSGAVSEMVDEGVTGFVIPPRDAESLARITADLFDNPALRIRMGEQARRQAVDRFRAEICSDTHVSAFQRALELNQAGSHSIYRDHT